MRVSMRRRVMFLLVAAMLFSCWIFSCAKGTKSGESAKGSAVAGQSGMVKEIALEFSADVVKRSEGGSFKGQIAVDGGKTRMETPLSVVISRLDKGVVWILMPEQKIYMEQPLKVENMVAGTQEFPGELSRTLEGEEHIGDRKTQKFMIEYEADGTQEKIFQWLDAHTGIPVKVESADGTWSVLYENLKPGKQKPELFEIPAGFRKMSLPAMGGRS